MRTRKQLIELTGRWPGQGKCRCGEQDSREAADSCAANAVVRCGMRGRRQRRAESQLSHAGTSTVIMTEPGGFD